MRAGIPVIVSEFTGSKEFVEKLDKDFVVPLTKEIILRKINNYFKLDIKSKKNLSKRAKRATDDLNEMNQLKEFKNEFNQLLLKLK